MEGEAIDAVLLPAVGPGRSASSSIVLAVPNAEPVQSFQLIG
jgi:hypothetical protein